MSVKQKIWSTKSVEEARESIMNGFIPSRKDSPFHENKIGIRKSGATFEMTEEEIDHYIKCYEDIFYFAENFCWVKGDDGKQDIIKLRNYQYDILEMFDQNRFSILMSSRQSGKCLCSMIEIDIETENQHIRMPLFKVLYKFKIDKNFIDYIKYSLYWMIYKLEK